jgi:hypothetical protein
MADDLGRKRAGTSGMERLLVATSRQKMQAGSQTGIGQILMRASPNETSPIGLKCRYKM